MLGRLIHCHQLLEKLILDYIKLKNPKIGPIEKTVWAFQGKLDIASRMEDSVIGGTWLPPISAINKLRNNFGHKLDAMGIEEQEVQSIRQFLSFWPQTAAIPAIDLIQLFVATLAIVIEFEKVSIERLQEMDKKKAELDKEWLNLLEEKSKFLDELFGNTN